MRNGYEFCKVANLGKDCWCVVDVRFPKVGKPHTFSDTKQKAEKAYAEQVLFVPYSEYKKMKKTGYVSAYKAFEK